MIHVLLQLPIFLRCEMPFPKSDPRRWEKGLEKTIDGNQERENLCLKLGGGFKHFLFSSLFGEDSLFD